MCKSITSIYQNIYRLVMVRHKENLVSLVVTIKTLRILHHEGNILMQSPKGISARICLVHRAQKDETHADGISSPASKKRCGPKIVHSRHIQASFATRVDNLLVGIQCLQIFCKFELNATLFLFLFFRKTRTSRLIKMPAKTGRTKTSVSEQRKSYECSTHSKKMKKRVVQVEAKKRWR